MEVGGRQWDGWGRGVGVEGWREALRPTPRSRRGPVVGGVRGAKLSREGLVRITWRDIRIEALEGGGGLFLPLPLLPPPTRPIQGL